MTSHLAVTFLDEILPVSGVSPTARAIAYRLALYADADTHAAWPRVATLARLIGVDPGNIRRAIYALEEAGLVIVERSNGRSNVYRFPVPTLSPAARAGARGDSDNRARWRAGTARADARGPRALTRAIRRKEDEKEEQAREPVCNGCSVSLGTTPDTTIAGLYFGRWFHDTCAPDPE
jgi:DNA-binding transcriptional ArsR family regulator